VAQALKQFGYEEVSLNDQETKNKRNKVFGHPDYVFKEGVR